MSLEEPTEIPTKRLGVFLRQFTLRDVEKIPLLRGELGKWISENVDKTSREYAAWQESVKSMASTRSSLHMGIWDREELVGSINLQPKENVANIGYSLREEYRGRGYATIALMALTEYALSKFREARALILPNNTKSIAVARRAGYSEEGRTEGDFIVFSRRK